MKLEDIITTIHHKIKEIRRKQMKEGSVIVSQKIMRDIQDGYYNHNDRETSFPFFPYFSQAMEKPHDKIFGIPLASIETEDDDFLEVYIKG